MQLKDLLQGIPDIPDYDENPTITSVVVHSQEVIPGSLFLVKMGKNGTGHRFVREAVERGASAILTDIYDPHVKVLQLIYPHVNDLEPILAHRFYRHPCQDLSVIGVTGTCGKTTTTFLIRHLLKQCGLIGTVECKTGKRILPSTLTTPELPTLLQCLREMKDVGYVAAALEISSQGIAMGRITGMSFSSVVFTNLSQEHLDDHKTMDNYAATKAKLFAMPACRAMINGDDPWSDFMVKDFRGPVIRYGLSSISDIYAENIRFSSKGLLFDVVFKGEKETFRSHLIGKFNVYNILAAASVALYEGMTLSTIARDLLSFEGVPGRLEAVHNRKGLNIFIDYAHTPHAFQNVLETCKTLHQGRLIIVFGCGGNRDRSKRPLMATLAEQYGDFVIITLDNPRGEDPLQITHDIIKGFHKKNYHIELDRKKALIHALDIATPQDMILIIGKGHETYQILANETISWDDRTVIHDYLR